MIAKKGVDVDQ